MESWLLMAPCTSFAATAFTIFALSSEHWTANLSGYAGLWDGCVYVPEPNTWICAVTKWPHYEWIIGVKILVILSASMELVTLVAAFLAYHNRSWQWSKLTTLVIVIQEVFLIAGLFVFLAYISIYGSRKDLSWSYTVGWISAGFYVMAYIFFATQTNRLRTQSLYENINGI